MAALIVNNGISSAGIIVPCILNCIADGQFLTCRNDNIGIGNIGPDGIVGHKGNGPLKSKLISHKNNNIEGVAADRINLEGYICKRCTYVRSNLFRTVLVCCHDRASLLAGIAE